MKKFLIVFAVIFIFLSCDDGKSSLPDEDILSDIDNTVEDVDVTIDEVTEDPDSEVEDESVDETETTDEDEIIEERSPEGIAVSSGTGTIKSGNYKMNLTVGKPLSGQIMKSENYTLEIVIK